VPGIAAHAQGTVGPLGITLEYNGAINDAKFAVPTIAGPDQRVSIRPRAWQVSLGYQFAGMPESDSGTIRFDYVYNDEDPDAATRDFSQVLSLVTQWKIGPWGLRTDLAGGTGYAGQSDVWGVVLMPSFDFSPRIQTVLRYTYLSSAGDNGLRLARYANRIVQGRGNEYNEIYAGLNVFFYGHKLKWQTGLEYDSMRDDANDGGEYSGWGLSTGLRVSW